MSCAAKHILSNTAFVSTYTVIPSSTWGNGGNNDLSLIFLQAEVTSTRTTYLHLRILFMFSTHCVCEFLTKSYIQYDLVWMPSTLDALLDTSPRLMSLSRGCYYSF